jgi:hypothetical protein
MKTRRYTCQPYSMLLLVCAAFALLLSACQPSVASAALAAEPETEAQSAPEISVTNSEPIVPPAVDFSLDLAGVAENYTLETIAAVADVSGPFWVNAPEHRRVTLQGYPVVEHSLEPQIFIYPLAELAGVDQGAGQMAADLQALLQNRQPIDAMPFLPLNNSYQVMHAQVQYLDFKNGSGVRFLTQFNQGLVKINSDQLFYTFQGITSAGKYYIAAVLPLTHPELPAGQDIFTGAEANAVDYQPYMAETVTWLEQQPANSFTPDLAQLDAMIQSLEVH